MLLSLPILVLIMKVIGDSICDGRAIMVEPPHRSSLWRFRYPTNINTEDDLLNCGGFAVQWEQNRGRCGICGDPAWGPFDHDDHGHFASGITVRSYVQGGSVNVTVEILSNLLGYFEFRLCPRNSTGQHLTHDCFEQNPLWIEESWGRRFYVGSRGGIYDLHVKLPSNIICSHCVFQWKYSTGYRMGGINACECMGCGRQEQFFNCADVEIRPGKPTNDPPFGFMPQEQNPSFLSSPKTQSMKVLQKLREQLPVFPWPNGLQIPHNMMLPAKQRTSHNSVNEVNGDSHHYDEVLLREFNSPHLGSVLQGESLFATPLFSSSLPVNKSHGQSRDVPILTIDDFSRVDLSKSKKSILTLFNITNQINPLMSTDKSSYNNRKYDNLTESTTFGLKHTIRNVGTTISTATTISYIKESTTTVVPLFHSIKQDNATFPSIFLSNSTMSTESTPILIRPDIPTEPKTTIPNISDRGKQRNQTTKKSVYGQLYKDSVIFPLFNSSSLRAKSRVKPAKNIQRKCDISSPLFHCIGRGFYTKTPNIAEWCTHNCRAGNCQSQMCVCGCEQLHDVANKCHAIGPFAAIPGMSEWCDSVCVKQKCPSNICNVQTCT